MFLRVSSGLSYKCNSPLYPLAFNELSCLFELIHLLVVMGWAGNVLGTNPSYIKGTDNPGLVGSGAPACPNTQTCGLCD